MKKYFIIGDIILQTLLAIVNTYCLIRWLTDKNQWAFIMISQLVCGLVQLVGCRIHISISSPESPYLRWRQVHFFGSIAFVLFLYMLVAVNNPNTLWVDIFLFLIPQMIFYSYYILCLAQLIFPMYKRQTSFF